MSRLDALEQRRQDLMTQNFPRRRIAEKFGDIDENRVQQLIGFIRMVANIFAVFPVVSQVQLEHAAPETALQRRLLVAAEVKVALLCQFLEQVSKGYIFRHGLFLPLAISAEMVSPILSSGTIRSTQPVSIAACGMIL